MVFFSEAYLCWTSSFLLSLSVHSLFFLYTCHIYECSLEPHGICSNDVACPLTRGNDSENVLTMMKNLFLQNIWADVSQTFYKAYLGKGNSSSNEGPFSKKRKIRNTLMTLFKSSSPEPQDYLKLYCAQSTFRYPKGFCLCPSGDNYIC